MAPRHQPPRPSESQELTSWKAKEYDRKNLEVVETLVIKVDRMEREMLQFKAKLGVVMLVGSAGATFLLHILAKYFKLT